MIPVTILTGFLGAGKTTVLNRLLKDPSMAHTAVIINEFGDVSLDHLLVERGDDDIIELSSGCLCCTIRGELITTLERLLERPDADQLKAIVIETTGLADPVPVVQAVIGHPLLTSQLTLGSVVTVVDVINGRHTIASYPEAMKQVAVADRLLISKTDEVDFDDELQSDLRKLNPTAPITKAAAWGAESLFDTLFDLAGKPEDVRLWLGAADDEHHHHHHLHDTNRHGETVRSFTLVQEQPMERVAANAFLELLASAHGQRMLRVKGLIKIAEHPDQPLLIHGVQQVFSEPKHMSAWPDKDERTRLVFIVDGLEEEFVDRLMRSFANVPAVDAPDSKAIMDNPLSIAGFSKRPH